MALKNPVTGGSWIAAPLTSSFAETGGSYLTPAYRKDSNGIVWLRGTASYVAGVGTTILTLPAGYRPTASGMFLIFAVDPSSNAATTWLEMRSNGTLVYIAGFVNVFTLDQIFFATY